MTWKSEKLKWHSIFTTVVQLELKEYKKLHGICNRIPAYTGVVEDRHTGSKETKGLRSLNSF